MLRIRSLPASSQEVRMYRNALVLVASYLPKEFRKIKHLVILTS